MSAEIIPMPNDTPSAPKPPVNLEAEAALIGAMLIDNDCIDYVADRLKPEEFFEPLHQRVYEAISRERSLGRRVSPVTLKPYFEGDEAMKELGGLGYLARLTGDGIGLVGLHEMTRQVGNLAQRRRIIHALTEATAACHDFNVEVPEILTAVDAALSEDVTDSVEQMSAAEAVTALLKTYGDSKAGVTSGGRIAVLDRALGPLRPKSLTVKAGRPGMGKTAEALCYSLGAARDGHGVTFVSLEMSHKELAARAVADITYDTDRPVPYPAIIDERLNDEQMRQVIWAESALREIPFQIVDAGALTTGALARLVRRHKRKFEAQGKKLELLVIDYLQLLRCDDRRVSRFDAVSEISRSLKALAKDEDIAIMALSQLSREVEKRPDKRPMLPDLRESGQIEQDADAVMFLFRPEYYHRAAEPADQMDPKWYEWKDLLDRMEGEIEFIVAKRRNGTTGTVRGTFNGLYQAVRG